VTVGDVYAVFVVFIAPVPLSVQSVSRQSDPVLEQEPSLFPSFPVVEYWPIANQ
jgi:hypothetical protein